MVRRDPLAIEQILQLEGDWQFHGTPVPCGEDLMAPTQFDYNDIHRARLVRFARVPAEPLDTSALPPGTAIYDGGRLVRASDPLPLGPRRLALFWDGHEPQSTNVVVTAGASARVPAPIQWQAAQPTERVLRRNLPAGDIAGLLARPPTSNTHTGRRYGDRSIELDRNRNLVAKEHDSARIAWQVDPLQALPSPAPEKSRFAEHRLLGVLPRAGLVLVATKGYLPNQLLAFELATGAPRWTSAVESSGLATDSAIGAGDPVDEYLGLVWVRVNTFLEARDARDGNLVYRMRAGRQDSWLERPMFHQGRVFFVFNEQLHGVRIADQKVMWRVRAARHTRILLDPTSDDLILVDAKRVRRMSVDGKVLATSKDLSGSVADLPPLLGRDAIYVCGHQADMVYAIDKRSMATRWSYKDKSGGSPCPVLLSDKELLITSGKHGWLLDRASGRVLGTVDVKPGSGLDLDE
jgi:outer membrane protein assembly factor BamB